MFKTDFKLEDYLCKLSDGLRRNMTRFRLSSHKLPIQQLRYIDVPRQNRLCNLCNNGEVGDEFHYLFSCPHGEISLLRTISIRKYFYTRPNTLKLHELMNAKTKKKLSKLAKFIGTIVSQF